MSLYHIQGHTILGDFLSADCVVLDLGANRGNFAHGMIDKYNCTCHAVEANPSMCQMIEPHPRLKTYNLAIAGVSGEIPFHVSGNHEESSILESKQAEGVETIRVQAVKLDEFLQQAGLGKVDLVKFDIEGAEIQVLDSCSDAFLQQFPQLTIEFHDFLGLTPVATVQRVVARLQDLGYFCVKMWRHGYGDTLFINRKIHSVGLHKCLWARYVTRNWWGLKRMVARSLKKNATAPAALVR